MPGSAARNSPFIAPLIPLKTKGGLSRRPQTAAGNLGGETYTDRDATTPVSGEGDHFGPRIRHASLQGQIGVKEAVSAANAGNINSNLPTATVIGNAAVMPKPESQNPISAGRFMGRLRNFGRSTTKRPPSDASFSVNMSPALGSVVPASVESTVVEVCLSNLSN